MVLKLDHVVYTSTVPSSGPYCTVQAIYMYDTRTDYSSVKVQYRISGLQSSVTRLRDLLSLVWVLPQLTSCRYRLPSALHTTGTAQFPCAPRS